MLNKLRLLFQTSRPISWVNTAYPFATGYLLMTNGRVDLTLVVGTLFFLIPYNLLMYGINDVFDYESDMLNPRKGGVEGAITPKKYHPLIVWSSVLLSIPFVVLLIAVGNPISTVVLAQVLFFVVAYSAKGLRFKEIPFLDSMTSSVHFVGPLLFAFSLTGINQAGWLVAGAFFAWGIASQALGAVQDILPDKEAGIDSIATQLGAKRTIWFAIIAYLVATVLVASIGTPATYLVSLVCLAYAVNCVPYRHLTDKNSQLARVAWKRFLWMNYLAGAILTVLLIASVSSLL